MLTRCSRRVEQLSFLLRRKPTVRLTRNPREKVLSLSKNIKNLASASHFSFCTFWYFLLKKKMTTIHSFVLFLINNSNNVIHVPSLGFLTLGTISAVRFYHLSNLVTCVTRVHVIGDFCHITCRFTASILSASKNVQIPIVSELYEI